MLLARHVAQYKNSGNAAEQVLKDVFLLHIVGTIAALVGCVAIFFAAPLWMALSVLLLGFALQVPKALRDSAD